MGFNNSAAATPSLFLSLSLSLFLSLTRTLSFCFHVSCRTFFVCTFFWLYKMENTFATYRQEKLGTCVLRLKLPNQSKWLLRSQPNSLINVSQSHRIYYYNLRPIYELKNLPRSKKIGMKNIKEYGQIIYGSAWNYFYIKIFISEWKRKMYLLP